MENTRKPTFSLRCALLSVACLSLGMAILTSLRESWPFLRAYDLLAIYAGAAMVGTGVGLLFKRHTIAVVIVIGLVLVITIIQFNHNAVDEAIMQKLKSSNPSPRP